MQDDAEPKRAQSRQPGANRDALRDTIAQEEFLLAKLEAEQTESRHRLTALRAELATLDTEPEIRVRLPDLMEGHFDSICRSAPPNIGQRFPHE